MNSQSCFEVIILAGGLGTRLRSEVPDLPKPLASVANRPFLEYIFDHLSKMGVSKVTLSVGYKHQLIVQHFGKNYRGMKVNYAIELEPRGTGGGLMLAAEKVKKKLPIVVMNGDTWFPVDLNKMLIFHSEKDSDITVAVRSLENPGRYSGVEFDDQQKIVDFSIHSSQVGVQWINGGVYIIAPRTLKKWKTQEYRPIAIESDLIPFSLENGGAVYAYCGQNPFIDIGIVEDYRRAPEVILNN